MNMDNGIDTSEHSYVSKDTSENGTRKGLFRRKSGDSDATEDTASSSERSTSFFRNLKRSNSFLKRSTPDQLPKTSDHTTDSQKTWFTSGSGGKHSDRRKEDIYNSAVHRAKERQAIKNAQNDLGSGNKNINSHSRRISLSDQLSALPPASDSDNEYDEIDEGESKSIFSSIIQKIENIYDDCS
jgi:hypothetical protein